MGVLKRVRSTVVSAVGPRAVHAAEDGFVIGVLTTANDRHRSLILESFGRDPDTAVEDVARSDHADAQESYFVAAYLVGRVVGTPLLR